MELPRAKGGVLRVGPVRLELTSQTYPCVRMDEARQGLLEALAKDWRGGVTCRVVAGGRIALGDAVEVLVRTSEVITRLPGWRQRSQKCPFRPGGAAKKPETDNQHGAKRISTRTHSAPYRAACGRAMKGAASKTLQNKKSNPGAQGRAWSTSETA